MIIHKLILQHLKAKDDPDFYAMQARDAISWIARQGVELGSETTVLDLGCGHGIFGGELVKMGCKVTFADETNYLHDEFKKEKFIAINLDKEDVSKLGAYDLVICSNVLEHLSKPKEFLQGAASMLSPAGKLYLSWTNWLSPWGGHEFSPFQYLGPKLGPQLFTKLTGRKRIHTPYENLFPTYIGEMLAWIKSSTPLQVQRIAPRYYPEFSFLVHIPLVREIFTWNCAMLLQKRH